MLEEDGLPRASAAQVAAIIAEHPETMLKTMVEKELKEKEAKWKAVEKDAGDGAKSLQKGKKDVETLQKKLDATGWTAEKEEAAAGQARELREQVRSLTEVSAYRCY